MPLRIMLVGPLPPPPGGMANQTRQLARLLEGEGVSVRVVRTNGPYRPAWIGGVPVVRALFRLAPYLASLYSGAGKADVVHVMANSGWAWHLFAAPAIWIARLRGVPVVVNYRGGLAEEFLARQARWVLTTLRRAQRLVVPTRFLQEVFGRYDIRAGVIPNIVDVGVFSPAPAQQTDRSSGPHIVITRNLEHLYGNDIALRALAIVRRTQTAARMTIAGSGPERAALQALADKLQVSTAVEFAGRLETAEVARLYRSADIVLNPSRADNTPNSVLEALASGVPVVSTDVGGVPYLLAHGQTAWLVPVDSPEAMAEALLEVSGNEALRQRLVTNGHALAQGCAWPKVRESWIGVYASLASSGTAEQRTVG